LDSADRYVSPYLSNPSVSAIEGHVEIYRKDNIIAAQIHAEVDSGILDAVCIDNFGIPMVLVSYEKGELIIRKTFPPVNRHTAYTLGLGIVSVFMLLNRAEDDTMPDTLCAIDRHIITLDRQADRIWISPLAGAHELYLMLHPPAYTLKEPEGKRLYTIYIQ
jgi:hypothetical protein